MNTKHTIGKLKFFFCLIPFVLYANGINATEPIYIGFQLDHNNYFSFSEQNTDFPMIAGYPALVSEFPGFGFNLVTGSHELHVGVGALRTLTSDNGSGMNLMLNRKSSYFERYTFDYAYYFPLFKWKSLSGQHALNAGVLYEDRYLFYDGRTSESTKDLNVYIGPRIKVNYRFFKSWGMNFVFDGRFYLPYMNKGHIVVRDPETLIVFESDYYAFYYQAVFCLNIIKTFDDGSFLEFGIRKSDIVGFANSRRIFYPDDLIHFKFDRTCQIYLSMNFELKSINDEK
jgi:hypothetical protein